MPDVIIFFSRKKQHFREICFENQGSKEREIRDIPVMFLNEIPNASNNQQSRTHFFEILLSVSHRNLSEFIPHNAMVLNFYNLK